MKFHEIQFREDVILTLYPPRNTKKLPIKEKFPKGTVISVAIKPMHKDGKEVADLMFEDNMEASGVSFEKFRFYEVENK